MVSRRTQCKKIKNNKSRKNKSRKNKSRRYRKQRGGDIQPSVAQSQPESSSMLSSLEKGLDETNKAIGDVKKETEEGISSMFGSVTSLFSSSNETQPTASSGGKRRKLRSRRKNRR